MQIRSKLLTAAAVVLLVRSPAASAQTTPTQTTPAPADSSPTGTPSSGVAGQTQAQPPSAARLPQAPSTLLTGSANGMMRPAGSGLRFVAPSTTPGPGGSAVEKPVYGPLALSLDDAISLGLQRNIRLKFERANQRTVRGYRGQIANAILPDLRFRAVSSAQEINLAAMGFKPAKLGSLLQNFGVSPGALLTIVKVNTTSAQVSLDQQLFNLPDLELYRAIKPEFKAVDLNLADSAEQLVQAVTTAYLKVLADRANLDNAIAQEQSARVSLDQATQRDQAGIGIRLDVLRAEVEYQQRQQAHVSADAQLDKDGIQLNRIMGLPAGQQLDLTDDTPFSELGELTLEQARETALTHRSDLLALQQSLIVASHESRAVRYQRLPTLAASGFYGVLGQDGGLFHGVFTAEGSLKYTVFNEAEQRGQQEIVDAQLQQLRDQEDNLRGTIEAQIRTSMLDVETASQLVKVAQSNVDLARQELADARERFTAGVSDNLEIVDAEATVTGAQAQLVSALYQFNVAKVGLARSTGVLESRYREFLGM